MEQCPHPDAGCGGGEGMVAVVRGLPDATLAVTLLDNEKQYSLLPNRNQANPGNDNCLNRSSVVDYNHNPVADNQGLHYISQSTFNSAQAPAYYKPGTASKYSSTDPVVYNYHSACLAQRDSAAQAADGRYASTYQVHHCRVTPTSPPQFVTEFPPQRLEPDRITYSCSLERTHQIEPFARSLRQYPRLDTDRSTEILERLISYTHNKNRIQNSDNITKAKHKQELLSNSLRSIDNNIDSYLSKNVQTYTRSKNQNQGDNKQQLQTSSESVNRKINNVEREIKSDILYKDSQLNAAYDYMRSIKDKQPSWMNKNNFTRDMDVRHLCNVTKCIRERIKSFCAEDNQCGNNACGGSECPELAERFMRHQRECSGLIRPNCEELVDMEVQAAARKCEKEVSTSCNRSRVKLCISLPKICQCKSSKNEIFPCPKCRTSNLINARVRRKIQNWHAEIPVCAHESSDDKIKRNKMVEHFIGRILEMADILEGRDLILHIDKEVKKFVKDLPMWTPGAKCCKDSLKEKMANNLTESLTEIFSRKPNILDETISDWIKDIPVPACGDQIFDKKKLQKELTERIKATSINRPSCDSYYKTALSNKIQDALEKWLGDSGDVCNKNRVLTTMSEQLAELVKDLVPTEEGNIRDKVENEIRDWIENNPELSKRGVDKDAIKVLSETLDDVLCGENLSFSQIQDEVIQWLSLYSDIVPDEKVISILTDRLMPLATSTPRRSGDASTFSDIGISSGNLVDNVYNILNKSGICIQPDVCLRLAVDIADVLQASMEQMCTGNDNSLGLVQSILQKEVNASETEASRIAHEILVLAEIHAEMTQIRNEIPSSLSINEKMCYILTGKSKCGSQSDQSYRQELEESIHEVLDEQDIHPNNEDEVIRNLIGVMESVDVNCGEGCFNKSFESKVEPEVSKLLSQCSHCPPTKSKVNNTLEALKTRFAEIRDRTAQGLSAEAGPSRNILEVQRPSAESEIIKNKVTKWVDELPLKSKPKPEAKEKMVSQLTTEINDLQKQQEKQNAEPSRYQQRVREKVSRWLKKVPLHPCAQANAESMADDLAKRVTMPSEYVDTPGRPNQAQLENMITNWLKNSSFYRQITAEDRRRQLQLVPQLASQLNEIQAGCINTSLDDPELINKMRTKIVDFLKNFPLDCSLRNEKAFQDSANELINQMTFGEKSLGKTVMNENEVFENIVSEWITNLPLPERLEFEDIQKHDDLKDKFIKRIADMRENPNQFSENAMRGEIIRLMSIFPIPDNKKRDRRFLYSQATDLIERLRAVPYNPEPRTNFNKYLDLLKREILIWIEDFPCLYADVEGEQVHKDKAASQLADKIFMAQVRNPSENEQEAFEEELYEIISRWLTAMNRKQIDAQKHRLTVRLIMRVNDLESRMASAVTQAAPLKPYKERYLENLAAGAVPLRFVNKEEEKMHENIIHNMANAFINRNYKLNDPDVRADLVETLCEHIKDFLNYVETLPEDNPNFTALRAELEEVLRQIPVPDVERAKLEQKMKQTWKVVTAWYKSLPVDPAPDSEEEVDRIRMLNYLSTKLAKIRKNLDGNSEDGNWDERMLKEIFSFLKNIPLYPNDCSALDEYADTLMMAYLDAERSLPPSSPKYPQATDDDCFGQPQPQGRFQLGSSSKKKPDDRKPKCGTLQKDLHEKHMAERPSDPSLLNRTADRIHLQRPRELVDRRAPGSAPPEFPGSCKPRVPTPHPTMAGEFESYYDPAYVDERFLDVPLENYESFKEKAQFSSSIMPNQNQPHRDMGACRACSIANGQTSKTTQSPKASINPSRSPQAAKSSQYHKACKHPAEEDLSFSKSFKSGRHSPKSPSQSLKQSRPPTPKADAESMKTKNQDERQSDHCPMMTEEYDHQLPAQHTSKISETDRYRCGQTRFREHYDVPQSMPARPADYPISDSLQREIDLKTKNQGEGQCDHCPIMETEEYDHQLPAQHTSKISESDRYRCGQTRFREHYDGPQSVPARPADYPISDTLQREIDLARQIGLYDEPLVNQGGGQGVCQSCQGGAESHQGRRQGPCLPMNNQENQQGVPGHEMPMNCPCVQKMLNFRSFGFFISPPYAKTPTDECPQCCNMCPCASFGFFRPPC